MADSLQTPTTTRPGALEMAEQNTSRTGRDGFLSRSLIRPSERPVSPAKEFNPETCLFCNQQFPSQQTSKQHMQAQHGLQVPLERRLIVDWETLAKYLHLIIYEYHECIYCHAKRRSARAVQEHMMTKNHCFIDIDTEESEFRDFYDLDDEDGDDDEWSEAEEGDTDVESDQEFTPRIRDGRDGIVPTGATDDDMTLRLPSGRIIANRKGGSGTLKPLRLHHRRKMQSAAAAAEESPSEPGDGASGSAAMLTSQPAPAPREAASAGTSDSQDSLVVRNTKGQDKFAVQRANLRGSDRQAIAHLPLPQQRALLATAQQQEDKADRAHKSFGGKMDGLGNIKVSERFVNDVPGGKAHRNRFFAR